MTMTRLIAIVAALVMVGLCGCGKKTTLTGSVVDGKMGPLEGIKVVAKQIQPLKGYEQFETVTKSDGSFKFNKLCPQSNYVIIVYPDHSSRNIKLQTTVGFDGKELKLSAPIMLRFRFKEGTNTVLDTQTGLTWTINANVAETKMNLSEATEWVKGLTVDGLDNWRLPTKVELASFVECSTGIDLLSNILIETGFKSVQSDWYWTSTDEIAGEATWGVNMGLGVVRGIANIANIHVWPVRDLR
jgi:hypothetical protein